MDFSFLFTPLSLSVAGMLAVFLLVQLAIDAKRAREQRVLRQLALASVRKHEARSVTVLIELPRSTDSIIPLLDHLDSHSYQKLQVVVVVKHTAGKNATTALRRYQRSHKTLKMRIVTHKKGMDKQAATKRFATGVLVMWLNGSERLSHDFFTNASLRFMDSKVDGLRVRTHARLDSRIRSAVVAWGALQHDMTMILTKQLPESAFILRRENYLNDSVVRVAYSSKVAVSDAKQASASSVALRVVFFSVLVLATVLSVLIGPIALPYLVLAPFLGLFLLMSTQLMSTSGYSKRDRLNLLLLLPLYPFLSILYTVSDVLKKTLRSQHIRFFATRA